MARKRGLDKRDFPHLGIEVDKSECIIWGGATTDNGYPLIFRKGRTRLYNRVLMARLYGPIPHGLCVCHRCDNPGCINPKHLFLATQKENMIDKALKGRLNTTCGEERPISKLTCEKVREIRKLYKETDLSINAVARLYGVGYTAVWNVLNRVTWRHVK